MMAPDHWQTRNVKALLLWPFSQIYWCVARWRSRRVVPTRLPVPVICVGNNTVGGTGKTPIVIALCQAAQSLGYHPHVISRGYKGRAVSVTRVDPKIHDARMVGDEPLLIAQHAPCWVARRRIDAANQALAHGANMIIMDDGMQNPSLVKDQHWMVVDGHDAFGNRLMLPAGPCREPLAVSLNKADHIVVMGDGIHVDLKRLAVSGKPVWHAKLIPSPADIATITGRPIIAFTGIGKPQKFFAMLKHYGYQLVEEIPYADHHLYSDAELYHMMEVAKQKQALLVCTQKDWVRLPDLYKTEIHAVAVDAVFESTPQWRELFSTLFNAERQ